MNKITLILLSISFAALAQKKQPGKEEKEIIYEMTYHINKEIFNPSDFPFKKVNKKLDEIQPKIIQAKEVINSSVDTLISRATLKLEKSEYGYDLVLRSRFPSYFKEKNEVEVIKFALTTSKLYNSKKELIENKNVGGLSFGVEHIFKYNSGKATDLNFTTLYKQNQINNAVNFKNNNELSEIKGSAIYNIKFITDYSQVTLSRKDIGAIFKINNIEYKLIDIVNNTVLIALTDSKNLERNNELRLINYDETGSVLVNYGDRELADLKKKNKKINDERGGMSDLKGEISQRSFDYFKSNPKLTLEEYKKTFTVEDITNHEGRYIFIQTIAPIKNNFVLYEPVYGIERTFEMLPNQEKPEQKKVAIADYNAPQLSANWNEVLFGNIKEYTENFYSATKKNGKYVKGKIQNWITYKKNENGEFVEDKMFPKKSDYPQNKYNKLKQKTESITYNDDDEVLGKTIYSYGADKKLIEEKSYSADDTLRAVVKYAYKKNQTVKTEINYNYIGGETGVTESETDLIYDDRGNLIEEHLKNNKTDSGYSDELVLYTKYNPENRKIESLSKDSQLGGDGKIKLDIRTEYLKNDNLNNWTEMFFEEGIGSGSPRANFVERIFVYE